MEVAGHVGPPAQQCRRVEGGGERTACCGRSTRSGAVLGAIVAGEALSGAMSPARRSRGRGRPPAGRSRRAGAATHGRSAPLSRRGVGAAFCGASGNGAGGFAWCFAARGGGEGIEHGVARCGYLGKGGQREVGDSVALWSNRGGCKGSPAWCFAGS